MGTSWAPPALLAGGSESGEEARVDGAPVLLPGLDELPASD